MYYIIDANNLAGKLNILENENFDKELIEIIKLYFFEKRIVVDLIFDSNDQMGDKYSEDNINIIYTPKDNYYKGADDKIVEIVSAIKNVKELCVITDDIELSKRVNKVSKGAQIIKARVFAEKINQKLKTVEVEEELNDEEKNEITKEMMSLWK